MEKKDLYDISVLIIEDEKGIDKTLEKLLKGRIKTIFRAFDGLEALELYHTHHIDLLITDVDIPKMNGIELISEIRNTHKDKYIPIVLITGLKDLNILVQAINLHIDLFLQKPLKMIVLKNFCKFRLN